MITKPTVLILGAGISEACGYPLAKDLKDQVLEAVRSEEFRQELIQRHGYSAFSIDAFISALSQSGKDAIENFLSQRSEFERIGLHAIAKVIRRKEDAAMLFKRGTVYECILAEMGSKLESFGKNTLSFISFNYDRSLEAFMYGALRNSYGARQQDICMQLDLIPIVRMRGSVGSLPWQKGKAVSEYGEKVSQERLAEAAGCLDVRARASDVAIPSSSASTNPLSSVSQARKLLAEAEVIAFLGFGYAEEDMELLGIKELEGKTILGSTYGLKPGEIKAIAKRAGGKIEFPKTKVAQALDAEGFLRESGVLGL